MVLYVLIGATAFTCGGIIGIGVEKRSSPLFSLSLVVAFVAAGAYFF